MYGSGEMSTIATSSLLQSVSPVLVPATFSSFLGSVTHLLESLSSLP
jgi:hypothetical protein